MIALLGKGNPTVNKVTKDDEDAETRSVRSLTRDGSDPKEPGREPNYEALQSLVIKF